MYVGEGVVLGDVGYVVVVFQCVGVGCVDLYFVVGLCCVFLLGFGGQGYWGVDLFVDLFVVCDGLGLVYIGCDIGQGVIGLVQCVLCDLRFVYCVGIYIEVGIVYFV